MPIKETVKIMLAKSDVTLTEIIKRLNYKYSRNDTIQNLSKKINKGTLRYEEAEEIAEVLDYKIEWTKKR
ncbi:LLM class flavin-dependent oxidoreductase [Clostridium estertheticum]|uniref:LLM class flavin-dependent oxidoreductase n=1 Tax=Clostridium estertheticum TaxID=238834 RepID=A0AA47I5X9_9CLOT|nr:LLM class flavin-dependent oxidoreductase [Clostridium estertheticum]MBU3153475.1 LLM class flavin-dependent oxidoreductase [Clostridium estertheticum]WAG60877.1 LLM class flavin-dependent oxidoreductase [Clostridium estertheticum]